jgi:phosphatidylserine/phosphatidylglycerophosphate/cardiolipin synthase-like enzyme
MSKVSPEGVSRKLIDHIVGSRALGPVRAMLATSFDLSPEFVDLDFLPSVLRLPTFDDTRVRSRLLLEGQLAKMSSIALLMEARRFQGRPRSWRVDLRPAIKAGGGVLHAKLVLLVHDEAVRLVVGSANLTTSGYRENREVAFALCAERKGAEETAVVRQALEGMPGLLAAWWSDAARTAHAQALDVLAAFPPPAAADDATFAWGGGAEPLWQQVLARWPQGEVVRRIRIVSPFWSEENGDGPIARLLGELQRREALAGDAELLLVTAAQGETTTTYRPVLPASYGLLDFRTLGVAAKAVAAKPQVDEEDVGRDDAPVKRALHAKVLMLEGPLTTVAYAGSANFTVPGWGFGRREAANIEAGIILRRRGRARAPLEGLIPPTTGQPVVLEGAASSAIQTPESDEQGEEFPTFLFAVELRPSPADAARLELVVEVDVTRSPERWSLALAEQDEPCLTGTAAEELCSVALSRDALNTVYKSRVVYVRWSGKQSDKPAMYPVNVSQAARESLPFGDPGALPGEDQLVAFYQGCIAWEDVFPVAPGEEGDSQSAAALPSAVDTSRILSYQVRSFVQALHGVRGALRDATATETTLRLALLGPVSPVALARQVHHAVTKDGRSPTAGAFQLVELLACLHDARSWEVDPRVAASWAKACQEACAHLTALLTEVRGRGLDLGVGSSFDQYAKALEGPRDRKKVGS